MNQEDQGVNIWIALREVRNGLLNGWQLSKLYTFEVAARHQSFALAADELSLSPSAAVAIALISWKMKLGIQLFVRHVVKWNSPTEGKRVFWALKSSLDTLNQEILDIKNQELSGTSPCTQAFYRSVLAGSGARRLLPVAIRRFR